MYITHIVIYIHTHYIFKHIHIILFAYSSWSFRIPGGFHVSVIVNHATMNLSEQVQVSIWDPALNSSGCTSRSGNSGSLGNHILIFTWNVLHSICSFLSTDSLYTRAVITLYSVLFCSSPPNVWGAISGCSFMQNLLSVLCWWSFSAHSLSSLKCRYCIKNKIHLVCPTSFTISCHVNSSSIIYFKI
jgi:hypothetical protein